MSTKYSQLQTRFFLHLAIKVLSLFAGILLPGSFATSHAQNRNIMLAPLNFEQGCPSLDDSVVQVSIDGVPMKGNQISVSPGPHNLSVVTRKDVNLIIKEIKYEDVELSQDGTTSSPRPQSFTPNTPDANVSITVYGPGTAGTVRAQQPARLSITLACGAIVSSEVSVNILVTWMCKGDVREEQLFPAAGAIVLIGDQRHTTADDGTLVLIEPTGPRQMTSFVPVATTSQKDERYKLAYIINAGTRYYPDATTGRALVPLTGKNRDVNNLTFRLIRYCPGNVPLSKEQLEIAKYVVLKRKGYFESITHLGNKQDAQVGMEVVNGDLIETSDSGAILLSIPDKLNRFQYYVIVHPDTKVRVFFVPSEGNDVAPKFVVEYGTISQKLIRGIDIRIKKNTVSDRTTVGLEDGTIYSWSYNQQMQETTVSVEEGAVVLTPKNPTLQPLTLRAGQQIQVTPNSVSAIRASPGISNIDYGNGISLSKVGNTGGVAGGPSLDGPSGGSGGQSSGISGTWTTSTGDTIILTQSGNRVAGTYRGILGTGTISGTFDGGTLTGTIEAGQGGINVADTFTLRLTPEGRLEGRVGSSILSVDVILIRRP